MFINLYKSLVRPIIEYGNTMWGPYYILDQQSIKEEQPITYWPIDNTPYSEHLDILGLPSLQYHQWWGNMILLYWLTHSDIGINLFDYFSYPTYTSARDHCFKLSKPTPPLEPDQIS